MELAFSILLRAMPSTSPILLALWIEGESFVCKMDSTVTSDSIAIEDEIQLVFSYYANNMEVSDGFCIDYSIDDGSSWRTQKCWHAIDDFDNGTWYDDVRVYFRPEKDHTSQYDMAEGIRLRFRCKADSLHDDMLIDKVQLLGLASGNLLKDAI